MAQKKQSTADRIKHEKEYIAFLEKRLASSNFRANEKPEVIAKTEEKLKKSKFLLKVLQK